MLFNLPIKEIQPRADGIHIIGGNEEGTVGFNMVLHLPEPLKAGATIKILVEYEEEDEPKTEAVTETQLELVDTSLVINLPVTGE